MTTVKKQKTAAEMLAAMGHGTDSEPTVTNPVKTVVAEEPKTARKIAGKKHIGGYFDRDFVEVVAILRARLGMDNSELIEVAVREYYNRHNGKRKFGDE